jgi:hypothetical protein
MGVVIMSDLAAQSIKIEGLSDADAAELKALLSGHADGADIAVKSTPLPPHKFGEPATFFVVATLTAAAITVLGAWLLKKRRRSRVHYSVTTSYVDGSVRTELLDLDQSESEAPPAELIEKLSSASHLPAEQIIKLLSQSS